jgi:hypothetical protein
VKETGYCRKRIETGPVAASWPSVAAFSPDALRPDRELTGTGVAVH